MFERDFGEIKNRNYFNKTIAVVTFLGTKHPICLSR